MLSLISDTHTHTKQSSGREIVTVQITDVVIMSEMNRCFSWVFCLPPQTAELAEYSAKIALLEEAKRVKEEEADTWQSKVSF